MEKDFLREKTLRPPSVLHTSRNYLQRTKTRVALNCSLLNLQLRGASSSLKRRRRRPQEGSPAGHANEMPGAARAAEAFLIVPSRRRQRRRKQQQQQRQQQQQQRPHAAQAQGGARPQVQRPPPRQQQQQQLLLGASEAPAPSPAAHPHSALLRSAQQQEGLHAAAQVAQGWGGLRLPAAEEQDSFAGLCCRSLHLGGGGGGNIGLQQDQQSRRTRCQLAQRAGEIVRT